MKKYLFILMLFSIGSSLFGQDFINYQFVPRDAQGNLFLGTTVGIFIKNESGEVVYQEQRDSLFSIEGVKNIKIGEVNPALFSQIDWSSGNYSIGTTIKKLDGNIIEFPDQPISSAPQALFAEKADTAFSLDNLNYSYDVSSNSFKISAVYEIDRVDYDEEENPYWYSSDLLSTLRARGDGNLIIGTLLNYPADLAAWNIYNSNEGADFYNTDNQRYLTIGWNAQVEIGAWGLFYSNGNPGILNIANTAKVATTGVYGTNARPNFTVSSLANNPNNGVVTVNNDQGISEATLFVAANGQGTVAADVKNFRMEHPTQPGKEIWYASVEGPEAAAYARGTARLENGQVKVVFPEHFRLLANASSMTVALTPLSADSKGLAVIQKGEFGFTVKEMLQGTGNYEFDWEVKVVRKGYEDYRVIRDAKEAMPAEPIKQDKF